jgi:hypothetical protein
MYGNKLSAGAGVGVGAVAFVAFPPPVALAGAGGGVGCPVLSINEDIKPLAESVSVPVALVAAGGDGCACTAVAFVAFVVAVSFVAEVVVANGGKPVGPGITVGEVALFAGCCATTGAAADKEPNVNVNNNIKATNCLVIEDPSISKRRHTVI